MVVSYFLSIYNIQITFITEVPHAAGNQLYNGRTTHSHCSPAKEKLSQAELGSLVGCSNNHISHIETAQTKVSLSMLSKLALALNQDLDYFLLDTQYAKRDRLIDEEIAEKLSRCNTSTLLTVNQMLDLLLKQQEMNELEKNL